MLAYLAGRPDRITSREELLSEVWGYASGIATRAVDATVNRLRAKIEVDPSAPDHIVTIWGTGYRFVPLASPSAAGEALDPFYGRGEELAALEDEPSPLVTLVGPGGAGKTRLARVAAAHSGMAVAFCDLTEAESGPDVVAVVIHTLHLPHDPAGIETALRAVDRPTLLVLDNAEHVVAAVGPVALAAAAHPLVRVITTSRERLGVRGEQVIELGPLAVDAARALLRERARTRHQVALDAAVADRIAELVDRLPLALELAVGLLDILTPEQVVERLAEPLRVLASTDRDRPARHASLRRALDGSLDACTTREREVLGGLTVFRGGFTAAAAEEVLGDVLMPLRALRARSLLRREGGRLDLYLTVRALAAEACPPEAPDRHTRWVLRELRSRFDPEGGPPEPADLRWLEVEGANVIAAWRRAPDAPFEVRARLALALHHLYARQGALLRAIEVLQALDVPERSVLAGHVHRSRANASMAVRDWSVFEAELAQALALAGETGDTRLEGLCHMHALSAALARGQVEQAQEAGRAATSALRRAGASSSLALTLVQHARVSPGEAAALLDEAVEAAARGPSRRIEAVVRASVGMARAENGDPAGCAEIERSVQIHRAAGDLGGEVHAGWSLARSLVRFGRYAEAAGAADGARERLERAGHPVPPEVHQIGGVARFALGDLDAARSAFATALVTARDAGFAAYLEAALALVARQRREPHLADLHAARARERDPGDHPRTTALRARLDGRPDATGLTAAEAIDVLPLLRPMRLV